MLRSWNLNMDLQFRSGQAIYKQITQKIIEEIKLGRLSASTAMPGTRHLASYLGVNRRTVVLAYDELIAQGWLYAQDRRGTFVASSIPDLPTLYKSVNTGSAFALKVSSESNLIENCYTDTSTTRVIELNDGVPSARLIPFEELSRVFRHALLYSVSLNRLEHYNPKGQYELRKSVATMLKMERGLHINVDQICTVRGSQMGIFLIARILCTKIDNVIFANLTYPPAREAFKSCGANILNVGLDEHGIDVNEIEQLCLKHKIRAVYVAPHHQYPTTIMMPAERRLRLLLLAEKYDFFILEDDFDHEFDFSHHPVLPIASIDRYDRVIYVGSLSKVLPSSLRVGYIVAKSSFIDECAAEMMLVNRQGNSVTEFAVSELMNKGVLRRHIKKTLKIYNQSRMLLAELLKTELINTIEFVAPEGGLAFWLKLKSNLNPKLIASRAIEEKMHIPSKAIFALENSNSVAIRLGFGSLDNNQIRNAVQILKRIL